MNYRVSPEILTKSLPQNTEIDLWDNTCFVSLVGFMFLNTRVKGFRIPFHRKFEEVNLRFYVKHRSDAQNEWRRGVVFIKEIVPKHLISLIANKLYGENYESADMTHEWKFTEDEQVIGYGWYKNEWNSINVTAGKNLVSVESGSEEEFIAEHYWGYTRINGARTSEYEVVHPKWKVYDVHNYEVYADFAANYGSEFNFLNNSKPSSVFLAEGSEISVKEGRVIK